MKFTLDKASFEAFNKDKWVELEGFYTPERIQEINGVIDRLIAEKKLERKEDIMASSHDLFRKIDGYSRLLQLPWLADIVYELASEKPLRLAYDQLYQAGMSSFDQSRESEFFNGTKILSEVSSMNEIVLGVMIALKVSEGVSEEALPFSQEAGRIAVISPEIEIPFDMLKTRLADRYLLLVFSTKRAQYLYNPKDPQNHLLKHLGYVYGDKLKDTLHPIILR